VPARCLSRERSDRARHSCEHFDALRKRLMPFSGFFKPLINRHAAALCEAVRTVKSYSRRVFNYFRTASHRRAERRDKNDTVTRKNQAAVQLGRLGGKARVKNQSPEERTESAKRAADARWAKQKAELTELVSDISKRTKELEKRAIRRVAKKVKA